MDVGHSCKLIAPAWYESQEGREFTSAILHRYRRKVFGILDSPNFPPHLQPEEASYKICLCGKAGVGKSSIVAKLAGKEVPVNHFETPGIEMSIVFWPAKIVQTNQVLLFKFMMWDAGEQAWKKFDHIPVAMKADADCVIFVFSLTNRATWDDLPSLIARTEADEGIAKMVVGTRLDQFGSIEVSEQEMESFESAWKIPVIPMANVDGPKLADGKYLDGRAGLMSIAPFVNRLTELLWYRDQLAAGVVRRQPDTEEQSAILKDKSADPAAPHVQDPDCVSNVSSGTAGSSERFRVTLC